MRLQIICRENEKDAWEAAAALVRNVTAERTSYIRTYYAQSVANQRVQELARTMGDLIAPNLWTGLTKARPGAGICIVGNLSNAPECCSNISTSAATRSVCQAITRCRSRTVSPVRSAHPAGPQSWAH
jgi:alkanesulfonate monooxygenase